jgi:hypothetical protein
MSRVFVGSELDVDDLVLSPGSPVQQVRHRARTFPSGESPQCLFFWRQFVARKFRATNCRQKSPNPLPPSESDADTLYGYLLYLYVTPAFLVRLVARNFRATFWFVLVFIAWTKNRSHEISGDTDTKKGFARNRPFCVTPIVFSSVSIFGL